MYNLLLLASLESVNLSLHSEGYGNDWLRQLIKEAVRVST